MTAPSGIKLCPLDEGEAVDIPASKTTVGRGSFLQVADKRVSRNHATLEINNDGKLVVIPIHTNPCFFKAHGNGQQVILPKDKPRILEHGDVLSLLPDKLFFQVIYSNLQDFPQIKEDGNDETKTGGSKGDRVLDSTHEEEARTLSASEGKEIMLPLKKKRTLPDWMKGAAKRIGHHQMFARNEAQSSKKETYVPASKSLNKIKPLQVISKTKSSKKAKISESDERDMDEEITGQEEERLGHKKSLRRRKNVNKRGRYRDDDDDGDDYNDDDDYFEDEEEEILPRRRPRAASLKKPKYTDDDFIISDEELDLDNISSDGERGQGGRRGKEEDSDFVLDEEDSGSDWESSSRNTRSKVKGGRTVQYKGRGSHRGKRKRVHDSDSISDEDSDGYVPRLSKRRAAVAATSRMKATKVSEEEDDEEDDSDEEVVGQPINKKTKTLYNEAHKKKSSRHIHDDDDALKSGNGFSDEEMEVGNGTKYKNSEKKPCQYGSACYRKNPKHFKEFSHPQNNSDGIDSKKKSQETGLRQKRAAALKQQEKLAALHDDSGGYEDDSRDQEDENVRKSSIPDEDSLNGDGNESQDSDSDFNPDEEESSGHLKKVKCIPQNSKKQNTSV